MGFMGTVKNSSFETSGLCILKLQEQQPSYFNQDMFRRTLSVGRFCSFSERHSKSSIIFRSHRNVGYELHDQVVTCRIHTDGSSYIWRCELVLPVTQFLKTSYLPKPPTEFPRCRSVGRLASPIRVT